MSLKNAMPLILKEYVKLEKAASQRGQRKLRVIREDIFDGTLELPYPEEHFKTVCAFGALNFARRIEQAVAEITRVLKPDGKIAAAIWIKQGRDYKDGVYYFARTTFYHAFKDYEIHEYLTIYQEKHRWLVGVIGRKL